MRINKFLADTYQITRKAADQLVAQGKVKIDGHIAKLGDKIDFVQSNPVQKVSVDQSTVKSLGEHCVYYVYNKPVGIVTHSPENDQLDIQTMLKRGSSIPPNITKSLFPIGRLDRKSSGLIILTNDGSITNRLLNPDYTHEKEYIVRTAQKLPGFFKKHMEQGINIDGKKTKPAHVEILENEGGSHVFRITLTEGRHHQIRRMCDAMRVDVKELKRTRIMNLMLKDLKPNMVRKVEGKELAVFLKSIGKYTD